MDFNEKVIASLQSEPETQQLMMQQIMQKYCFVNGKPYLLADIEKMDLNDFSLEKEKAMPPKLYKYFPNTWKTEQGYKKPVNYSLQALKDNTVYLQTPSLFDDVYDSDIHIEWEEYANIRLQTYCRRCKCNIGESASKDEMCNQLAQLFFDIYKSRGNVESVFLEEPKNDFEKLHNQIFATDIMIELQKGLEWNIAILNSIFKEHTEHMERLRNIFRTSCFTTTPYSQLMWGGHYADHHRGFCLEYSIDPTIQDLQEVRLNLFPVIYCKPRPNMTKDIIKIQDEELTKETVRHIYFHGALRKSIDWAYQNEWRFLRPKDYQETNHNIPFFPISKVFLGNRMDNKDRSDIIEICHQKNIPYVGVRRDADKFEMRDCEILCEKCPRYLA